MHTGFDEWLSKSTARPSSLACGRGCCCSCCLTSCPLTLLSLIPFFESRQQAAEHARENALWLARLMASEQKSIIDVIRQQLQSLAQLPSVRRPQQAALCSQTFANLRAQNAFYANLGALAGGLIETTNLPKDSTLAILDNHGTILARHPDPETRSSWMFRKRERVS